MNIFQDALKDLADRSLQEVIQEETFAICVKYMLAAIVLISVIAVASGVVGLAITHTALITIPLVIVSYLGMRAAYVAGRRAGEADRP